MTEISVGQSDRVASTRIIEVWCTVDIENTIDSLHAHVTLDGVEVGPGDQVLVHGAPPGLPYGEKGVFRCRATVTRAGWTERQWIKAVSWFGLTELYEVSFSGERL